MTDIANFITKFHTLNGTTLGERRKSLFFLLHTTCTTLQPDEITNIIIALEPNSYLENIFKLEIAIRFKKTLYLLDILKSEHTFLIERILKLPWFFENGFENITGDQLVYEIFPYTSYVTRSKIINKLSIYLKNESQANMIFDAIIKKYGLSAAGRILPACTSEFILEIIKDNKIIIGNRNLTFMAKKNPLIVTTYFEELSKYNDEFVNKYIFVFKYLAVKNTALFLELLKKYQPNLLLGVAATRTVITTNKEEVIRNAKKFANILHPVQLRKSLKEDFLEFYFNSFPAKHTDFSNAFNLGCSSYKRKCHLYSLIQNLPKPSQLKVLEKGFFRAYNLSIWDYPEYITSQLLELLSPQEREKWISLKSNCANEAEERWLYLLPVGKCLEKVKNIIRFTSSSNIRSRFIEIAVKCCAVNHDQEALLEVVKYFFSRHKNEEVRVRRNFLSAISNQFNMEKLSQEHWRYIDQLLQMFTLNDEDYYEHPKYIEKYIHFRLLHNLPIEEEMKSLLHVIQDYYYRWDILNGTPYEKKCINVCIELVPICFSGEKLVSISMKLLMHVIKWNKNRPTEAVCIFSNDNLIFNIKLAVAEETYDYEVKQFIAYCVHLKSSFTQIILELFWNTSDQILSNNILIKLIRQQPEVILNNLELFMTYIFKTWQINSDSEFWRMCKHYSHVQLPQNISRICLDALKGEEKEKHVAIVILSVLLDADEFLQNIRSFLPVSCRLDVTETKENFRLHKAAAVGLKNVRPAILALENIVQFYKGDFLKLTLSALHHLCYNGIEHKVIHFLTDNLNQGVSLRKHLLNIIFQISTRINVVFVLNDYKKAETNATILHFLFCKMFSVFCQTNSDDVWQLTKSSIESLNTCEKEKFDLLVKINKVPYKYMLEYVTTVWEAIEKINEHDVEALSLKCTFLDAFNSTIFRLTGDTFCEKILEQNMFKVTNDSYQQTLNEFSVKCIIYCNSQKQQDKRLEIICINLKKHSVNQNIRRFFRQFCAQFYKAELAHGYLIQKISEKEIIQPQIAIEEFLLLNFTILYSDLFVTENVLYDFGKSMSVYFGKIICDYSSYLIPVFSDVLRQFTDEALIFASHEKNKYLFIKHLLRCNESVECMIMILHFFSNIAPSTHSAVIIYKDIINIISECSDPTVQIYLNRYNGT